MRLLEIVGADLAARNLCRNREDRHTPPVAIEQPVDQVKVTGTATPGADGKLAGDVRVRARGKGRHFLMADVDPLDGFMPAHCVGDPIERIADNSVDSL